MRFVTRTCLFVLPIVDLVLSLAACLARLARVDAVYPGLYNSGEHRICERRRAQSETNGAAGRIPKVATKLFVGNLDFSTSESELRDLFAQHGTVATADIVLDRMTGRSRGFAFVAYESAEEAQRAIGALDGAELNGRQLSVSVAREREGGGGRGNRPGGGRGHGGGRGGRW